MKPRPLLITRIAALFLGVFPLASQKPVESAGSKDRETDRIEARLAELETWLRNKDGRRQWQGIRACVQMGRRAVPMLTRLLQEKPEQGRPWPAPSAAKALMRLGPEALECLPAALELLKSDRSNNAQQKLALDVLGAVGPFDRDQNEVYMTTVYEELRRRAVRKRGKRKRRRRMSTREVVDCMVRLSEDPRADIDELVEHLQGEDAVRREMALDWLGFRDQEARRAIPAIQEVAAAAKQPRRTSFRFRGPTWAWSGSTSTSNHGRIRWKAALLLTELGAGGDLPVAAQIQLVKHEDPAIRQRAVLELGARGARVGARGIQALQAAIFDQDKLVAWDAITALGMIGPAARSAVPRLQALARSDDKAKAARAEAALRRIQERQEDQEEGKHR